MLPALPTVLRTQAERAVEQSGLTGSALTEEQLAGLAFSDFVLDNLQQNPDWWQAIADRSPQHEEWRHYAQWLSGDMAAADSEASLMRVLRLFRRRMLVRIAWMQCLHHASTEQTLQQLSVLAEVLISAARDWVYQDCCREFGTPCNAAGEPRPLLILGMGKLGGGELNFSSDIDLIFVWPDNGSTRGGRRELDNAQFLPVWGSA